MDKEELGVELIKLAKSFIGVKFGVSDSELKQIFYDKMMSFDDLVSELVLYAYSKVKDYNDSKSNFSTYCYMLFNTKVLLLIKYNKNRLYNLKSLDKPINENMKLIDLFYKEEQIYDKEILDSINEKKSEILSLWLEGKTQEEIGKMFNISQSYVSRLIRAEIKQFKDVYTTEQ